MKRFIADALLILLLVFAGSYMHKEADGNGTIQQGLKQEIDAFEEKVATHRIVSQKREAPYHPQRENAAGRIAQSTSELVEHALAGTSEVFASLFDSLIK